MSVTGEPDGAPVKCGVPLADFSAGLYAAFAIAAALRQVESGGHGMHIDIPMLGTSLAIAALQTSEYFGSGRDPVKLGSAHPRNAPYQAFRCRDGYFGLAAGNDALWLALCRAIDRPELGEDGRFSSTALRARNQDVLRELLEQIFLSDDGAMWLEKCAKAGVPCAPINSYSQVLKDLQVEHMEWVQPLRLPTGAMTRTFASPIRLSGKNLPVRFGPPALGQDTMEVLKAVAPEPQP